MKMGLLSLLRSDEQSQIDAAWRRYAALLESDNPDPKALAELKSVMHTLGKSTADAEEDAKNLREARRLVEVTRDGLGLEGERVDAHKAAEDFAAESLRIASEREQELVRLQGIAGTVASRWLRTDRSSKQLVAMRQEHEKLLGHVQSPTVQ
jgi:hypothetical protein